MYYGLFCVELFDFLDVFEDDPVCFVVKVGWFDGLILIFVVEMV